MTMRAAVLRHNAINIESMPIPIPQKGQLLVRVLSCGICGSDINLYHHGEQIIEFSHQCGHPHPMDLHKGVIMGHEFCAEIVDAGSSTLAKYKPGQRIVARPQLMSAQRMDYLGFSSDFGGGFAEYMLVDEREALTVPNGLSSNMASMTEPLAVAMHAVNSANMNVNACPVVIGCGPIGLAIITILKQRGHFPLIASEPNEKRRQLALAMGADIALHPEQKDFVETWVTQSPRNTNPASDRPPWVLFNCAGKHDVLEKLLMTVPRRTHIIQVGIDTECARIMTMVACPKELTLQFVSGYSLEEFAQSLTALSEGTLDLSPMQIGSLGLEKLPSMFSQHALCKFAGGKMIVNP